MGSRTPLVLLVLGSLVSRSAYAQPADDGGDIEMDDGAGGANAPKPTIQKDPKAAKKAFATGQAALTKGDGLVKKGKADEARAAYEEALAAFTQATDLGEDINYYYYLAATEDKLGKFVDAVKHYRMVLRAQKGVQPQIAKVINQKLDDELAKVGTVQITVNADGAAIMLAGEQVGTSPLPEPLILMPGTYNFSVNAPGYQPKEVEIKVEAGSESERKVELESVQIIIEKPRKPDENEVEVPEKPKGPSMIPVYVAGGLAVALIGTSVATGLAALSQHDTFVAPNSSKTARDDARAAGKDYAHLTDACLAGAVVSAGFAAYWYVFQVRGKRGEAAKAETSAKLDLVPWVQPDTSGLTVLGRF